MNFAQPKTLSLLFALLVLPNLSHATLNGGGAHAGNGGDAVVCRNRGEITSIQSLDRYEAKVLRKLIPNLGSAKTRVQILDLFISRISQFSPERARLYSNHFKSFEAESNFVRNTVLVDIPDSGHLNFPAGCAVEQIIIQNVPNFPEDSRYVVAEELWKRLSPSDQAILMLHEAILREVITARDQIEGCNDEDCAIQTREIRYLNSLVFSGRSSTLTHSEFLKALESVPFLLFLEHFVFSRPVPVFYRVLHDGKIEAGYSVIPSSNLRLPPLLDSTWFTPEQTVFPQLKLGKGFFEVTRTNNQTYRIAGKNYVDQENALLAVGIKNIQISAEGASFIDVSGNTATFADYRKFSSTSGIESDTRCHLIVDDHRPFHFTFDLTQWKILTADLRGREVRYACENKFFFAFEKPSFSVDSFTSSGLPLMQNRKIEGYEKNNNGPRRSVFKGILTDDLRVMTGMQSVSRMSPEVWVQLQKTFPLSIRGNSVYLENDEGLYVPKRYRDNTPVWGVCKKFARGMAHDFTPAGLDIQKRCDL